MAKKSTSQRESHQNALNTFEQAKATEKLPKHNERVSHGPQQSTGQLGPNIALAAFRVQETSTIMAGEIYDHESKRDMALNRSPHATTKVLALEKSTDSMNYKPTSNRNWRGKASKVFNSPSCQVEQPKSSYQLRRLSKRRVSDQMPATRKFHMTVRKNHMKKNSVSQPRDEVDWDEDLRPSDDNTGGAEKEMVTSISSPFPGDISAFDKSLNSALSKRKKKGKPRKASYLRAPRNTQTKIGKKTEITAANPQSPAHATNIFKGSSNSKEISPQTHTAAGLSNNPTARGQNHPPTTDKQSRNDGARSHIKQGNAENGEAVIIPERISSEDTKSMNMVGGRGQEVGKKLAAALDNGQAQTKPTCQKFKPNNEDCSDLNSYNESVISVSRMTPKYISPLGGTPTTQKEAIQSEIFGNETAASFPQSQWRISIPPPSQSNLMLSENQERIGGQFAVHEQQQKDWGRAHGGAFCVLPDYKNTEAVLKHPGKSNIFLRRSRKPHTPFPLHARTSPKKLFIDRNGSPLVIHLGQAEHTSLLANISESQGSGSGYDGWSESDIWEGSYRNLEPEAFPVLFNGNFPAHDLQQAVNGLSKEPDARRVQIFTHAKLNTRVGKCTNEASKDKTPDAIHKQTRSILLASTQVSSCR